MYKKDVIFDKGTIKKRVVTEGETIEEKVERIVSNKEPIKDGAPLIYTERKEGVGASYNIRTDRFEVAIEATDRIERSYKAKRENNVKLKAEKGGLTDGEAESTQGKDGTSTQQ